MVIKLENKFMIYVTKVFDECSLSFFLFKLKIVIYKLNEKNTPEKFTKEENIYEASTYKQLFLYIMKSPDNDISINTFREFRTL